MKKKLTFLLVFLLVFTAFSPLITGVGHAEDEVKVKLRNKLGNTKNITLKITGEYFIKEDQNIKLNSSNSYSVKLESGSLNLYRNNSKLKSYGTSFTIGPKAYGESNYFSINGEPYLGTVQFTIEGSYIRPVNMLPFEDYLKGVVPGEMPASWNVEALKAQAVAARTYAMGKVNNSSFDDTISNQVYDGYKWYTNSTKAVDGTAGQVLRSGGKLASAFYSSSNGGHTESSSNYWGGSHVSYLPSKVDPYDPQIGWNLSINKVQIDASKLDLLHPEKWWNTAVEKSEDAKVLNYIRSYIEKNTNVSAGADIKIVAVPALSVSGSTTADNGKATGKSTRGSVKVEYFVRNKNGEYVRESNNNNISNDYATTLGGSTRYNTSVEISKEGWTTSGAVVLGRGDKHLDAITGTVLAKKLNSPLLLTESNDVPSAVLNRIKELKASTVYVLGGTAAVSEKVETELKSIGVAVKRVNGSSRYQTSTAIAQEVKNFTEVFITSGDETSPDALSISSYAADKQVPILLTNKDSLDSSVKNLIKSSNVKKVTIVGGTSAVSSNVESQLRSLGISNISRISGSSRYETSIQIAEKYNFDLNNVFFAQGETFIDALPGAVLAASKSAPVVLTEKDSLPGTVQEWVKDLGLRPHVYYLGGTSAISESAKTTIKNALLGDIKTFTLHLQDQNISKLRAMFGGTYFKSYHIDQIQNSSGKFTIKGKGFGHGVGMSQYGAKAMGDQGKSYVQILNHYYPGAQLGK
ncbi:SpoIID/LytB domain-containing protein [Rossellomorea vietnamensis]|uniref:SpoIID/LytB domain-containing protein n=1 Tax=Rossellomorea vietnamensis TaxID=218284 RepID=UPI003CE92894